MKSLHFSVEVKIVKQLYEDNGYTYKPALQTVKWLQHYFTGGMLDDPLPAPALCLSSHTGNTVGRYCYQNQSIRWSCHLFKNINCAANK